MLLKNLRCWSKTSIFPPLSRASQQAYSNASRAALDSSQHLFGTNYSPPPQPLPSPPPQRPSLKLPKYKMKITITTPSHSMEGGPM